ncbi:hypothetical protein IDM40_03110 [Nocardiopsis sp. HNM0947]|uniref:Uncharacterized protein n=1 Tax=Nocardiopsis coralli TaxID=2772213 RepID=A0ABR9P1I9_9ACTN|nr:hypothetical protein [Nocardiopsis coralli]MBE2997700.1 hypothetical protein [Nocardiopsis coralli]
MAEPAPSPLVHRAVLPVQGDGDFDLLATVRRRGVDWVRSKHRQAVIPQASGRHLLAEHVVLDVASAYAQDGSETGVRFRLREAKEEGLWQTTLTAVSTGPGEGWAGVDLEYSPEEGQAVTDPKPPRVIRELTGHLPVRDGSARVHQRPAVMTGVYIPQLVRVLTNAQRRLPCIVAARPSKRPDPEWRRTVDNLFRQAAGFATLYELEDSAAANALKAELGHALRIDPGGIRTYLPGLDPEDPGDAHRHRVLSAARLTGVRGRGGAAVVARGVQDRARQAVQPSALRHAAFADVLRQERESRERELESVRAAPDRNSVEELRADLKETAALLELADKEIADLRKSKELAELRVASLTELNEKLTSDLEDAFADHFVDQHELHRVQNEVGRLRAALRRTGREDEIRSAEATEVQEAPTSFDELLGACAGRPRVCFTGDESQALELDETGGSKAAVWAGKAWRALVSLDGYAAAKSEDFAGAFHEYCSNPPGDGEAVALKQLAMSESQVTLDKYGHERIFPVPEDIAPEGEVLMEAHIKLDSRGSISPRVYFMDCTAEHGIVVVGYIGRHLTNTRTN